MLSHLSPTRPGFLRKEVIQPHLPIRLPCYDFTPVTDPTFDCCALKGSLTGFGYCQLPWCDGRCVQDPGTHSPRHSDPRLLATPTSCTRVAECNPNWDRLFEFRMTSLSSCPVYLPLQHVCSPSHKGHDDLTSSPPSSGLSPAVLLESPT